MALNLLLSLLTGKAFFGVALSIPAIAIPLWWFFYFSRRAQRGVGNVP